MRGQGHTKAIQHKIRRAGRQGARRALMDGVVSACTPPCAGSSQRERLRPTSAAHFRSQSGRRGPWSPPPRQELPSPCACSQAGACSPCAAQSSGLVAPAGEAGAPHGRRRGGAEGREIHSAPLVLPLLYTQCTMHTAARPLQHAPPQKQLWPGHSSGKSSPSSGPATGTHGEALPIGLGERLACGARDDGLAVQEVVP